MTTEVSSVRIQLGVEVGGADRASQDLARLYQQIGQHTDRLQSKIAQLAETGNRSARAMQLLAQQTGGLAQTLPKYRDAFEGLPDTRPAEQAFYGGRAAQAQRVLAQARAMMGGGGEGGGPEGGAGMGPLGRIILRGGVRQLLSGLAVMAGGAGMYSTLSQGLQVGQEYYPDAARLGMRGIGAAGVEEGFIRAGEYGFRPVEMVRLARRIAEGTGIRDVSRLRGMSRLMEQATQGLGIGDRGETMAELAGAIRLGGISDRRLEEYTDKIARAVQIAGDLARTQPAAFVAGVVAAIQTRAMGTDLRAEDITGILGQVSEAYRTSPAVAKIIAEAYPALEQSIRGLAYGQGSPALQTLAYTAALRQNPQADFADLLFGFAEGGRPESIRTILSGFTSLYGPVGTKLGDLGMMHGLRQLGLPMLSRGRAQDVYRSLMAAKSDEEITKILKEAKTLPQLAGEFGGTRGAEIEVALARHDSQLLVTISGTLVEIHNTLKQQPLLTGIASGLMGMLGTFGLSKVLSSSSLAPLLTKGGALAGLSPVLAGVAGVGIGTAINQIPAVREGTTGLFYDLMNPQGTVPPRARWSFWEALKAGVAHAETGHIAARGGDQYRAVGEKETARGRALGKYQFLLSTARAYTGRPDLSAEEFLSSPALQETAYDRYMDALLRQFGGDWRKAVRAYGGFETADPSEHYAKVTRGAERAGYSRESLDRGSQEINVRISFDGEAGRLLRANVERSDTVPRVRK